MPYISFAESLSLGKTLRLLLWFVFISFLVKTFFSSINEFNTQLITNILTGSGFSNLVTLVFGVLSITISIAFFVLSESRNSHANEKSTKMLNASQKALNETQNLINSRFDTTNELSRKNHEQLTRLLAQKVTTNLEVENTLSDIQELARDDKQDEKVAKSIKELSRLMSKSSHIDNAILETYSGPIIRTQSVVNTSKSIDSLILKLRRRGFTQSNAEEKHLDTFVSRFIKFQPHGTANSLCFQKLDQSDIKHTPLYKYIFSKLPNKSKNKPGEG